MRTAYAIIAIGLLISQPIFAQTDQPVGIAIEMHTGPVVPSDSVDNIDIDAGWNFGATATYYVLDNWLGIYAGFEVDSFEADSVSSPDTSAALLFGYSLGLEYSGDIPNNKVGYFARGGMHISKFRILDNDDDELSDTKYDTGIEVSAGLTYDLKRNWALRTGIRYKEFSRRFRNTTVSANAELDSTALMFGARYKF